MLRPEELVRQKCCVEMNCFLKLSVAQIHKARPHFCQHYPTFELQRKMILNWLESNQPEDGIFSYYISGKDFLQVISFESKQDVIFSEIPIFLQFRKN